MFTQKGNVMGRIVLATLLSLIASAAQAEMQAILETDKMTARVQTETAELIAFYTLGDQRMDLTVVLSDTDGDVLRSRIGLADGQTHAILLGTDDPLTATRYSFQRVGRMVGITISAEPGPELAGNL